MTGREKAREFLDEFIGLYVDELRQRDFSQVMSDDISHLSALVSILDRMDGRLPFQINGPKPKKPGA